MAETGEAKLIAELGVYALTCLLYLQLEDNLKAIELVPKLTQEVMDKIDKILKNKPEPASTYGR